MAETYCGKTCAECAQKEALSCPGCKAGPGRQYGGDCDLARCARKKSHETCDTCSLRLNCSTLQWRDRMPDYRRRRMEAEQQRQVAIARRAPVLGKWLWILFWLIIPSTIASVMTEIATEIAPALYIPGQLLNAVVVTANGVILLILASEEDRYRTAGICSLVSGAVSILIAVISGIAETAPWMLLVSLPLTVVSLVGEYNEFMGHAAVLTGVDNEQSTKWERLWKWFLGMFCGLYGSVVIIMIVPLIGFLLILASAIGLIVVSIAQLVYLYRTAQIFRNYTAQ